MRVVGIVLLSALALGLFMAPVCCADEDGCGGPCPCLCCGHNGLYLNPVAGTDAAIIAVPVQAPASPLTVSLCLSPDFPPPRA